MTKLPPSLKLRRGTRITNGFAVLNRKLLNRYNRKSDVTL